MIARTLAVVCLLAVSAPAVRAQSAPSGSEPWRTSALSVSVNGGLSTPYGAQGIECEGSLAPWVAVALGIGRNSDGRQIAGSVRIRHVIGAGAVGLSMGVAHGDASVRVSGGLLSPVVTWRVSDVTWMSELAYYEHRAARGWLLRGYLGVKHALHSDVCVDGRGRVGCDPVLVFPVVGAALGVHF